MNIFAIDDLGRTIDIKRGFNNFEPHPNALISYDDIDDDDLRDSLFRLATWVADNAISGPGLLSGAYVIGVGGDSVHSSAESFLGTT